MANYDTDPAARGIMEKISDSRIVRLCAVAAGLVAAAEVINVTTTQALAAEKPSLVDGCMRARAIIGQIGDPTVYRADNVVAEHLPTDKSVKIDGGVPLTTNIGDIRRIFEPSGEQIGFAMFPRRGQPSIKDVNSGTVYGKTCEKDAADAAKLAAAAQEAADAKAKVAAPTSTTVKKTVPAPKKAAPAATVATTPVKGVPKARKAAPVTKKLRTVSLAGVHPKPEPGTDDKMTGTPDKRVITDNGSGKVTLVSPDGVEVGVVTPICDQLVGQGPTFHISIDALPEGVTYRRKTTVSGEEIDRAHGSYQPLVRDPDDPEALNFEADLSPYVAPSDPFTTEPLAYTPGLDTVFTVDLRERSSTTDALIRKIGFRFAGFDPCAGLSAPQGDSKKSTERVSVTSNYFGHRARWV